MAQQSGVRTVLREDPGSVQHPFGGLQPSKILVLEDLKPSFLPLYAPGCGIYTYLQANTQTHTHFKNDCGKNQRKDKEIVLFQWINLPLERKAKIGLIFEDRTISNNTQLKIVEI